MPSPFSATSLCFGRLPLLWLHITNHSFGTIGINPTQCIYFFIYLFISGGRVFLHRKSPRAMFIPSMSLLKMHHSSSTFLSLHTSQYWDPLVVFFQWHSRASHTVLSCFIKPEGTTWLVHELNTRFIIELWSGHQEILLVTKYGHIDKMWHIDKMCQNSLHIKNFIYPNHWSLKIISSCIFAKDASFLHPSLPTTC